MKTAARILRRIVEWSVIALVTIGLLRAFNSRKLPDLQPWHRVVPTREPKAADVTDQFTLQDYLARENEIFQEVEDKVEKAVAPEDRIRGNRYFAESPNNPLHFQTNWNRTFELVPQEIKGGALLIHGLTDSPYSMRRIAEHLRDRGIYALCLRMPAHGTTPGALTAVHWQDWLAVARMGGRHVRGRIGPGKPFYLVGYSNGSAIALHYSVEALTNPSLPKADRLVLLSPEIGVAPFSRLTELLSNLALVPFFEKTRWLDVFPEYIPFKYNSFPVNAGRQSLKITNALQKALQKATDDGKIKELPPILAFQSLVDATIRTGDVVDKLFDRLADNGSELVLFDINRSNVLKQFLTSPGENLIAKISTGAHPYRATLITNAGPETPDVVERSYPKGGGGARPDQPLGLSWPKQFFSLSHVALPFATDDPTFGYEPDLKEDYGMRVGLILPRGEKSVLKAPLETFMRLNSNPFFSYVDRRITEWLPAGK